MPNDTIRTAKTRGPIDPSTLSPELRRLIAAQQADMAEDRQRTVAVAALPKRDDNDAVAIDVFMHGVLSKR